MARLLLLLPLSGDTALAALSLGLEGKGLLAAWTLALAEGAMAGAGLVIGTLALGAAPFLAVAGPFGLIALGALGLWGPRKRPAPQEPRRERVRVWGIALAISLDELGAGLAYGTFGLQPLHGVLFVFGQALVAATLGFIAGARHGRRRPAPNPRLVGAALMASGIIALLTLPTGT